MFGTVIRLRYGAELKRSAACAVAGATMAAANPTASSTRRTRCPPLSLPLPGMYGPVVRPRPRLAVMVVGGERPMSRLTDLTDDIFSSVTLMSHLGRRT